MDKNTVHHCALNAQTLLSREEDLKETDKISDTSKILKGEIVFTRVPAGSDPEQSIHNC